MIGRFDFGESKPKKSEKILPTISQLADGFRDRLRTANILLIGMKALANEIAKNLVLAGIGSMTIQDDQLLQEDDLGSQFFVSEQHVGQNVCYRTCEAYHP